MKWVQLREKAVKKLPNDNRLNTAIIYLKFGAITPSGVQHMKKIINEYKETIKERRELSEQILINTEKEAVGEAIGLKDAIKEALKNQNTIDELKVSLEEAHSQMNEHDPAAETPQLEVSLKSNEEE